jgi:hypothetical protein
MTVMNERTYELGHKMGKAIAEAAGPNDIGNVFLKHYFRFSEANKDETEFLRGLEDGIREIKRQYGQDFGQLTDVFSELR